MTDVSQLLDAAAAGDARAAAELLPLVYDELRKLAAQRLANEKPGQTLQATALVHEAYLRLVPDRPGEPGGSPSFENRGHFFAAAAEAMRRILINRARDKGRLRRGGGQRRVDLDALSDPVAADADGLLDVDDALERLAATHPECAELVKLRFYAGLTLGEAAAALGLARRTADRQWAFARAWLFDALAADEK